MGGPAYFLYSMLGRVPAVGGGGEAAGTILHELSISIGIGL